MICVALKWRNTVRQATICRSCIFTSTTSINAAVNDVLKDASLISTYKDTPTCSEHVSHFGFVVTGGADTISSLQESATSFELPFGAAFATFCFGKGKII